MSKLGTLAALRAAVVGEVRRIWSTSAVQPRTRRASHRLRFTAESLEARQLLSTVNGQLWHDANADGVHDEGESPLVSWTVFADLNYSGYLDEGEPATATDSNGGYSLPGAAGACFPVRVQEPANWQQTDP